MLRNMQNIFFKCLIYFSGENEDMICKIISGEIYSKCSVLAASKNNKFKRMFNVNLKLHGWKNDVVMEVIHKQFNHSPNKVLALKLRITGNEPFKNLLRCPLLAQLGNFQKYYCINESTFI